MKKEKSAVLFGALTTLITLFLVINIVFQNLNSSCEKRLNEMQNNITESWFRVAVQQGWASSFLETNQILDQLNKSPPISRFGW